VLFLVLLMAGVVCADTHIIQVTKTEPMAHMGTQIPGQVDTSEAWIGEEGVYYASSQMTSIVRQGSDTIILLSPQQNMYFEIPMASLQNMDTMLEEFSGEDHQQAKKKLDSAFGEMDFDEIYEKTGDSDQARQMMQAMKGLKDMFGGESGEPMVTASVTETDETKTIGDWDCRKYLVEIKSSMGMNGSEEVWATDDVDVDYMRFMTAMYGNMAAFPGYAEMMQEMSKIKGTPVYTTVNMSVMGSTMKSVTEVISLEKQTAPEGIFEIPEGYEKGDISQLGAP
jgi:hypothetical protein